MALNPAAFGLGDDFGQEAARIFAEMRASEPLPGHDLVRLPGDGKTAAAAAVRANGITLKPALRDDLDLLASEYGFAKL
jgi:LDH2 family malate/lactate/ureidoglycolate dehydrogenase